MDASKMDLQVENRFLGIYQVSVFAPSSLHMEAEIRAILDGIILAQRIVPPDLWIESDSNLVIHCITRGRGPWSIQATLCRIRHLIAFDCDTISHIYCEGNQVADLLALEGWERRCYFEYNA
ncbi:Uncharacterized protein Adt_35006 [Abeliophyllum distichum]|uniref:RNase H type-1 domain-containing protein n=1 Tax=Abeliophyllum distichum TaxID=126358 RepID=A0ABD1QDI3_9LAMI